MSRKGNCWDNAPTESFFNSLKIERVHGTRYATRQDAKADLFEYIEMFYNPKTPPLDIGLPVAGAVPSGLERQSGSPYSGRIAADPWKTKLRGTLILYQKKAGSWQIT